MKIVKFLLIWALVATSLLGSKVEQDELKSDMRTMLSAMEDLQRAGFYNNKKGVRESAKKLIDNLDSLITSDARAYLPDAVADAGKFAKKREKMIKMYANDLVESIQNGNYDDAIEDYAQILTQCTSCHSRIRKRVWK
ncbi:hypothetical protein [Sulfurimonas sp.]|uniref:hypothetical protein n=1 Tax=Sulfurimonas sp. TaxID=2022749 RepID=UPI002B4AA5D3|nr:hypothetical protein [Sulfurimonas sp.]